MIILDTDHMVVLKYAQGPNYESLMAKLGDSPDQNFATTCISLEEQLRGWLALIHRTQDVHRQVSAYDELNKLVDYFARWTRLPFDDRAAEQFKQFRSQKIRVGTMDLKIASIALVYGARLLSANLRDYQQIPDLVVEDWLH